MSISTLVARVLMGALVFVVRWSAMILVLLVIGRRVVLKAGWWSVALIVAVSVVFFGYIWLDSMRYEEWAARQRQYQSGEKH